MMEKRVENELDADRLRRWLEEGRPVQVIDIRPAADYQAWHIPGSLNIDAYQAIHANHPGALADYQAPPGEPVVLVCFVGQTSKIAAQYLRSRGIQAMSLSGGMSRWSLAWNTAEVPLPGGKARVIQARRTGKGCLSYLVGSQREALVIDPSLDPQVYVDLAAQSGWRITQVLDTHIHADHLSRSRALAEDTGAAYLLPRQERVAFEYTGLEDGDEIQVGEANLKAIASPGHTFESMSFHLDGKALFTGDTLFLDGIGRPDLNASPAETEIRARLLYKTLKKILSLDPQTLILPCHTGRPVAFDRAPLTAPLQSILENVKALSYSEEEFIAWILGRMPPTPPHFEDIVGLNEAGQFPGVDPVRLEAGANRCAI